MKATGQPDLSSTLRGCCEATARVALLGVEHEFQLIDGSEQVDFREVIHELDLGVSSLDPRDPFAYRLASGGVLTCDGREAEVALPPEPVVAGFAARASRRAADAIAHLRTLLPDVWEMRGHSTHISVSVPDDDAERLARLAAITVAPAIMLLASAPDVPGIMVRPRPGRVELGCGFIPDTWLAPVSAFAVGCVLHLQQGGAIPELVLDVVPADHRHGWYVDRRASGHDLNVLGRHTPLVRADSTRADAQAVLASVWEGARAALDDCGAGADLEEVDDLVAGRRPVRLEDPEAQGSAVPAVGLTPSPFGELLATRARRGFEIAVVMATWDVSVFVAVSRIRGRRLFICIPRDDLRSFLEQLDAGDLDSLLRCALRGSIATRELDDAAAARRPGLFTSLGTRSALLAPEIELVADGT